MLKYPEYIMEANRLVIRRVFEELVLNPDPSIMDIMLEVDTTYSGVLMEGWLQKEYPEKIALIFNLGVIELRVSSDTIHATLTFNGVPSYIEIPFAAIILFYDRINQTGFRLELEEQVPYVQDNNPPDEVKSDPEPGEVISLDDFRKK